MAIGNYGDPSHENGGMNLFNDTFCWATKQQQKAVDSDGWSTLFRTHVFDKIDPSRFEPLYSEDPASRPSVSPRLIVSALVLKELDNLSDKKLASMCISNMSYRNALGIGPLDWVCISKNTFTRFRNRILDYEKKTGVNILHGMVVELSEGFMDALALSGDMARIDSMMIDSRGAFMTRLAIAVHTNKMCLRAVADQSGVEKVPEELFHYLKPDDANKTVYHGKGMSRDERLMSAINDSIAVKALMGADDALSATKEYGILCRMIADQTKLGKDGKAVLKENSEIKGSSLQNPYDPDATYRKKNGEDYRGYVGNLVVAFDGEGRSIVRDYEYAQNIKSDPQMMLDYIESSTKQGKQPKSAIADGAYSTPAVEKACIEAGIELHTTSLTGARPSMGQMNAEFSEDGTELIFCGIGEEPVSQSLQKDGETIRATMPKDGCCGPDCPFSGQCHLKEQKNGWVVKMSVKGQKRAQKLDELGTDEAKKLAGERNAVEGVPSEMRNTYRVDFIPVFGLARSEKFFDMKVLARNFRSLVNNSSEAYLNKRKNAKQRPNKYVEMKEASKASAAA